MESRIEQAMKYYGWNEWSDHTELNRLMGGIDVRKTSWCAAFVSAIERQCGGTGVDSLMARKYLRYGSPVLIPTKGCIVVLNRPPWPWNGHIGFFLDKTAESVLILGGNQDNSVSKKWFKLNRVLGYRKYP